MSNQTTAITRRTPAPIKVYCLPDERAEIETMASSSGHSVDLSAPRWPRLSGDQHRRLSACTGASQGQR